MGGKEDLMMQLVERGALMVLKAMVWVVLVVLRLALEVLKIFLLLFGLVARVFLIFVKATVPD